MKDLPIDDGLEGAVTLIRKDSAYNTASTEALRATAKNVSPYDQESRPEEEHELDTQACAALEGFKALGEGYTPRDPGDLEAIARGDGPPSRIRYYQDRLDRRLRLSRLTEEDESFDSASEYSYSECDDDDDAAAETSDADAAFWLRVCTPNPPKPKPEYHPNTFILAHVDLGNHKFSPSYKENKFVDAGTVEKLNTIDRACLDVMRYDPDERLKKLDSELFRADEVVAAARREAYWRSQGKEVGQRAKTVPICESLRPAGKKEDDLTIVEDVMRMRWKEQESAMRWRMFAQNLNRVGGSARSSDDGSPRPVSLRSETDIMMRCKAWLGSRKAVSDEP